MWHRKEQKCNNTMSNKMRTDSKAPKPKIHQDLFLLTVRLIFAFISAYINYQKV